MSFPLQPPAALALAFGSAQQGITPSAANHLLQMLYVLAAVLAFLLLVVLAVAVIAWRKNKDKDLRP